MPAAIPQNLCTFERWPKVLPLGSTKEKKEFSFALLSLIRTFERWPKVLPLGSAKEKKNFLLHFSRLFVPL